MKRPIVLAFVALLISAAPVSAVIAASSAFTLAQAETMTAVVKAADLAREKDVLWLALAACIGSTGLAGYLVKILVAQKDREAENKAKLTQVLSLILGELRELRTARGLPPSNHDSNPVA